MSAVLSALLRRWSRRDEQRHERHHLSDDERKDMARRFDERYADWADGLAVAR